MKNSQLALRVFIGLISLVGLITLKPVVLKGIIITISLLYIYFFLIDSIKGYYDFGKKYNIFYYISKFLDSFPQIIKEKKEKK
jgi:hypothetical protein